MKVMFEFIFWNRQSQFCLNVVKSRIKFNQEINLNRNGVNIFKFHSKTITLEFITLLTQFASNHHIQRRNKKKIKLLFQQQSTWAEKFFKLQAEISESEKQTNLLNKLECKSTQALSQQVNAFSDCKTSRAQIRNIYKGKYVNLIIIRYLISINSLFFSN